MATGTKTPNTTDEQDKANDVGQRLYEREFNRIKGGYSKSADSGQEDENIANGKRILEGDVVNSNYNADDPDTDENINSTRDQEESGGDNGYYRKDSSEETASSPRGKGKLAGRLLGKGKKPTSGVVGLMLFSLVVVGGGSAGLAGTLLVNMKEIFHNDRSDASRTNRLYSRAYFANKFKKDGRDACSGSKVKCVNATMEKSDIKRYQELGYKIEGAEIDENGDDTGKRVEDDKTLRPSYEAGADDANQNPDDKHDPNARIVLDKITFPDGQEARSGKEFYDIVDKNPSAMRSSEKAFNSKSKFYLNKYFNKVLSSKWNFSKAKKEFPASNENGEQDRAVDEQTGNENGRDNYDPNAPPEERERDYGSNADEIFNDSAEDAKGKGKGGLLGTIVQLVCTPYRLANGIVTGVKTYQIARLGAFFLFYVQAADEIKDGRGDGAKVNKASSNLTYYESNEKMTHKDEALGLEKGDPNPKYNLSATDSQGYRTAAHGDTSALTAFAAMYVLGGGGQSRIINATNGVKGRYEAIAKSIGSKIGIEGSGRKVMKNFCRKANNPAYQLTVCPQMFAASGPFAAIGAGVCGCIGVEVVDRLFPVPDAVNPLKPIQVTCDKAQQMISGFIQDIIKEVLENTNLKEVLEKTLALFDANSDTKGVDAGNALAAGAGLVLSTAATGYGTKPASAEENNKEVSEYIAFTQPLEDRYIALEKADAAENPFDITNKYSVTGTLARSMNISDLTPTSLFGNISTVAGVFPMAFKTVVTGQSVAALYNQPSTAANGTSGRYDRCEDEDLADIGAVGDSYCSVMGVVSKNELKDASAAATDSKSQFIDKLADWMTNKQPETFDNTPGALETCAKLDGTDDNNCELSKQASIQDDGTPVPESQYDKYLQYCTDQRKEPWGAQSEPYEQGSPRDQRWYTGEQCMKGKGEGPFKDDDLMVANFRMWTNFCLQSGTRDGWENCYKKGSETTAEGTSNAAIGAGGDWVMPTSGPCLSPFGPRGGALHAGIDVSPPQGTPIVAPTDIKIISAGDAGDGYGYSVVARAIDGSKVMFRFGHMVAQPPIKPGQEVAKGQEIGKVGSTGDSTGPHLHFEIYDPSTPDGAYASNGKPLDPIPVLQQHGVSPPPCSS